MSIGQIRAAMRDGAMSMDEGLREIRKLMVAELRRHGLAERTP